MKKIYIIFIALLSLYSCNKWLTITPQGQVDAKDLLTTVKGYNIALNGVYTTLSSPTLYGKNMTYGMMDAMAQYWNLGNQAEHMYYNYSRFTYKNAAVEGQFKAIWRAYYSCITQCNLILENLETNRDKIEYSEIIEGEAYGLRAFCHMELFKYFGQVIKTKADLDKKSIAYRTKFDVTPLEFNTGNELLEKIAVDLKKAKELLTNDPINLVGRKGDLNTSKLEYNPSLYYRGARMNYYATIAMLARVEQMRLNPDEACMYAEILIKKAEEWKDSKVPVPFVLMDKANIEVTQSLTKDMNYSREMIFSVYVDELWVETETFFGMNGRAAQKNMGVPINSTLYLQLKDQLYFRAPDGSANDNRYRYWFQAKTGVSGSYDFLKLHSRHAESVKATSYEEEIGIFQLSEAYYIACESLIGKDSKKALEYLNTVRRTRNLVDIEDLPSDELLRDYLIREERKNFIGDGLMFYIYKRNFAPIYVDGRTSIAPLDVNFVWPIPDSEYEFSPNVKPENK